MYICNQLLSAKGEFRGIALGKNCIRKGIESRIKRKTILIANEFYSLGYRGIFDIDFVVNKKGIVYAVEANMRRTGGTHVYDLAMHLFNNNWVNDFYIISDDSYQLNNKTISINNIFERLRLFLYSKKKADTGIIITNYSRSQSKIGYIVISKTRRSMQKYLNEIKKL